MSLSVTLLPDLDPHMALNVNKGQYWQKSWWRRVCICQLGSLLICQLKNSHKLLHTNISLFVSFVSRMSSLLKVQCFIKLFYLKVYIFSIFSRQNVEIDFLHRKVELVHNDSIANREDVARMISELTLKVLWNPELFVG